MWRAPRSRAGTEPAPLPPPHDPPWAPPAPCLHVPGGGLWGDAHLLGSSGCFVYLFHTDISSGCGLDKGHVLTGHLGTQASHIRVFSLLAHRQQSHEARSGSVTVRSPILGYKQFPRQVKAAVGDWQSMGTGVKARIWCVVNWAHLPARPKSGRCQHTACLWARLPAGPGDGD